MIAYRLAEHVAHRTDVDAMLDEMTPEQFDEWCAKDLIEPIGYQTQMLGFIAYMLQVYMSGEGKSPNPEDVMPWLKFAGQNQSESETKQAKALILTAIGQANGSLR